MYTYMCMHEKASRASCLVWSTPPPLPQIPPCAHTYIYTNKQGKELAFAFGINLSCSRLGSVINNLAEPEIADRWGGA